MIATVQAKRFKSVGEYDVVVMGAGPGGIGAAEQYVLNQCLQEPTE